jgi:histidinol-phosphatase (PHP family)
MLINLHNHTPLCNHATGDINSYIQKAISSNISYFGFSDHAPMQFDKKYRMDISQKIQYEKEILKYKEIYKDKINILLAYEVDFIKDYMLEDILNSDVDYLIGSVHFINKWGFDNPEFINEYKNKNIDDIWQDYFDCIENMAKSGYFNIVGHLDLIKVFSFFPKKDIRLIAKNAIKAIKKSNMVVEINSSGLRKRVKEQYPSKQLLQMCFEENIDITISTDAHKIEDINNNLSNMHILAKAIGYNRMVVFEKKEKIFLKI